MSRFSIRPRPRDSVFTGGAESYRGDSDAICSPNLYECVLAMESLCEEVNESQRGLRNGTRDLPRMAKVLDNEKVFLLVDEGTIRQYKSELTDEIEPQIHELISRAEKGIKGLYKRRDILQAKVEQAQSRPTSRLTSTSSTLTTTATAKLQTRRLQILTKQRQLLEADLHALQVDVDDLELKLMNTR
ncbi:hypothetical protein JAAARDRAFT_187571 [Jaapia argillacea MUCL 33604]|uniref:DASH complex subunit SPC19 n=1 Tax=Jaapia argillacea MUCL 33604 TaxID=933084 RepID=A0A067QNJ2_9AGAM|nr:hypothetical protein JAAARDRAFT_187571 [Jaapia argillacea MUCL 33604]